MPEIDEEGCLLIFDHIFSFAAIVEDLLLDTVGIACILLVVGVTRSQFVAEFRKRHNCSVNLLFKEIEELCRHAVSHGVLKSLEQVRCLLLTHHASYFLVFALLLHLILIL